jgi:hypothetical protein
MKVRYLSSDCGATCSADQDPNDAYKEEYKRELADNHLYYGNKDVSQEDIFLERQELQPRRPQFTLPSYEAIIPTKSNPNNRAKSKSDSRDSAAIDEPPSPTTPSEPASPPSSVTEACDNEAQHPYSIYTSRHEPWKKRQPKGHGKTIKHESDSEEE